MARRSQVDAARDESVLMAAIGAARSQGRAVSVSGAVLRPGPGW
ncbi:MAG: hypothetical protein ACRBB0_24330 [Pelagimonas sp.]